MKALHTLSASLATLIAVSLSAPVSAAVFASTYYNTSLPVPDNDLNGVSDTRSLTTPITSIVSLRVTLDIAGDSNNGDLYAYIRHGSTLSVLLNRVGRTALNDDGYFDSGFAKVLFDDVAANGDVHTYQTVLNPNGAALTGTWQPDARFVDPADALNTSARTAFLSAFTGADPNGNWTIFVADVSPGGQSTLLGWGLEITSVPEPSTVASSLVVALGTLVLAIRRRNRKSRQTGVAPVST